MLFLQALSSSSATPDINSVAASGACLAHMALKACAAHARVRPGRLFAGGCHGVRGGIQGWCGWAPEEWKEAGTDPANYRPISLLNTIHKVFAAMLQSRLAAIHDGHLRGTQYGFRAQRSTFHPLFILRRAIEWSGQTSPPLCLLFLDWKQAFDSIDHNAMLAGLRRFGLSECSLKLIHTLSTDASFYTEGPLGEVARGRVGPGIRQGCPLSPYLLIIVLTVFVRCG